MSVWERIDANGHAHALTGTEDKRARQRYAAMMGEDLHHVRVGQRRQDGTQVTLIGTAAWAHGPGGLCVCCNGRQTSGPESAAEGSALPVRRDGDTGPESVRALVHPRIGNVRQYRGTDTMQHERIREAMRRFRPGQPLGWGSAC